MKHANSSPTSDTTPRLRVGLKDVSQPAFADALTQQLGKHRITIMLDDAVVRAYKARAGGRGYQTLINETLRRGLQADAAKDDLREVVRCPVSCDHIPRRSWPLFRARAVLRSVIESMQQEAAS